MQILSITGTKGKTSVTRMVSQVLSAMGNHTLRVDTDGCYIDEQQVSSAADSHDIYHLSPTVSPGRYLLFAKKYFPDITAVLETSIGCRGNVGLGYKKHNIGVFTNVYEDHINPATGIMNKQDIATAKNFIFRRIADNGSAVFNADDDFVCSQLAAIPKDKGVELIPYGINFSSYSLEEHIARRGVAIVLKDNVVCIQTQDTLINVFDITAIPTTFKGTYVPVIYNVMAVVATLYGYYGGEIPALAMKTVAEYTPPETSGRLVVLTNSIGIHIIIDFAHERASLIEIGKLAKTLCRQNGKTIGVLRLSPDRTNNEILATGNAIASSFDSIITYDKVDGVRRDVFQNTSITRQIGETAELFLQGIQEGGNAQSSAVIYDKDAIFAAARNAEAGDVVVVIYNHDPVETLQMVKKAFAIQ